MVRGERGHPRGQRDDHVVSAGCSGGLKAATTWSEVRGGDYLIRLERVRPFGQR